MGWWRRYLVWRQRNVRQLATTERGFVVTGGASLPVAWDDVRRITAFKRDLLTVDLLCLVIEGAGGVVEVDEEMLGYAAFEEHMAQRFHLLPDWKLAVLFPAFATNATPVYERDGVTA